MIREFEENNSGVGTVSYTHLKTAMDYLKALRDDPDLAEEFDSLFDFFLLDDLSPRDEDVYKRQVSI